MNSKPADSYLNNRLTVHIHSTVRPLVRSGRVVEDYCFPDAQPFGRRRRSSVTTQEMMKSIVSRIR